jgi:hypothetical protein
MDDYDFCNVHKDQDQNIDIPHGQLDESVRIYEIAFKLIQVNVNFLEEIQHSITRSVWYNLKYER